VRPTFDVEGYARESDSKVRALEAPATTTHSGPRRRLPRPDFHPSVLVVDSDLLGRAAIVRGLLRAQCPVTAAASLSELDEALGQESFDAALVNGESLELQPILDTIVAVAPELPVVILGTDEPQVAGALAEASVARFTVCGRGEPTEALLEAIHAHVSGG
jgi:DNA-binding NtrC family response regulator